MDHFRIHTLRLLITNDRKRKEEIYLIGTSLIFLSITPYALLEIVLLHTVHTHIYIEKHAKA